MSIQTNLAEVYRRIALAAAVAKRNPHEIKLLAVSKNHALEKIRTAIEAGQLCFGESYLQAALPKIQALANFNLEWHFIGAVQSNKTKQIAENFAWVHSVDREVIAARLARYRPASLPPLNICLQVNVNDEATKAGVTLSETLNLAKRLMAYSDRLCLRGLMAIPQVSTNEHELYSSFANVSLLYQRLKNQGWPFDTLSMGMSQDLELAIQAGSTLIRIGSNIFGKRA